MKRINVKKIINNLIFKIKNLMKKHPKESKIVVLCLLIVLILVIVFSIVFYEDKTKQKHVKYNGNNLSTTNYPGYKELIDSLQKKYPDWTFTLFYTRLDWNDVIENEGHKDGTLYPLNLIPDSSIYPNDWKCEIDKDKTFDNGTWLCASDKAIKYQMDPRNILNEENVFQFKELNYVDSAQTIEGLKEITNGSFLEGDNIAESLMQAGKNSNLDPYFIASRLIQEQGRKGTTLSRGYLFNDRIVYNPFNIKATGNSSNEIIENAARYAYEQGWDTLEKGLIGGVNFVKVGYIDKGQNTLYLQKFDVVNQDEILYKNQYMQNLLAPMSEARNMLDVYKASDTIDSAHNFIIPLYENMPQQVSER